MFGAGKAKKPQPATWNSTPEKPVPVGTGVVRILVWALSAALGPRALPVADDLCLRERLLLLQRRYPQPRLRNADRLFWICATPMTDWIFAPFSARERHRPARAGG